MKKLFFLLTTILLCGSLNLQAAELSSLTWAQVCSGKMGDAWYGTEEAKKVADVVLYVQKTNGGWMKNDQLHKLTDAQKNSLYNQRGSHSCFDNVATTQEMRFLAKVYQKTGVEKYKTSFQKALKLIFTAEKRCGGWSQYYPLTGGGSYRDYITFNDDLITNIMKLLRDIASNKGDFADIVDETSRTNCQAAFDRCLATILKCQVDDNGTLSAWCAQHDTINFQPAVGRPHELPSISGSESASLLSFLMSIEKPSKELQNAITAAVKWLDAHKIPNKAIENFTNADGESDRRVIDKAGSAVWGRFIQLGGETGQATYNAFFDMLKKNNKTRSYTTGGKTYSYTEYEIATTSYKPEMAYQPIYAIYDDGLQHLYYRFLYSFEDAEPVVDSKGLAIVTSLNAKRRTSYQFLGSWPLNTINVEYPAWLQRVQAAEDAVEYDVYTLSADTYNNTTTSGNATVYNFDDGITVSNEKGKGYGGGTSATRTVKYSANVPYTVTLPVGVNIHKVKFYGYDNYDVDAYLSAINDNTYAPTDYVFPAKVGGEAQLAEHTVNFSSAPLSDKFVFTLGSKQCALVITLYHAKNSTGIENAVAGSDKGNKAMKYLNNGSLVISRNGNLYNAAGQLMK